MARKYISGRESYTTTESQKRGDGKPPQIEPTQPRMATGSFKRGGGRGEKVKRGVYKGFSHEVRSRGYKKLTVNHEP